MNSAVLNEPEPAIQAGLNISEELTLPIGAAALSQAIIGLRGQGKSNTGCVITEECLRNKVQELIIDPLDVWYGVKLQRDGVTPSGLPIVIIGGHYGDFPIEHTQGEALARVLTAKRCSAVVSCSHMKKKHRREFVADLFEELYQLKDERQYRTSLHVTIDEAGMFVPQRVSQANARVFASIEEIVRRGRTRGFGVTLIDQRTASVNKDVLSMTELLFVHKLVSPQDRDALMDWAKAFNVNPKDASFFESLGMLKKGEAWVCAAGWQEIFQRAQIRLADTYDSRKTPEPGAPPEELAIESSSTTFGEEFIAELRDLLSTGHGATGIGLEDDEEIRPANIEGALRERIRTLEKQLADKGETPMIDPTFVAGQALAGVRDAIMPNLKKISGALGAIEKALFAKPGELLDRAVAESAPLEKPDEAGDDMSIGEALALTSDKQPKSSRQRMLDLLAHLQVLGIAHVDRQTAIKIIGADARSSTFMLTFEEMLKDELIERIGKDQFSLTDRGSEFAEAVTEPISLLDFQERVIGLFDPVSANMIKALIDSYPEAMSRADLGAAIEFKPTSSAFNTRLSMLKLLGFIVYPERGYVCANDKLYPNKYED